MDHGHKGRIPLGSDLSNALSKYSVDKFDNPVKTEADDEADLFKNLEFPTKLGNIHGIQNTGSQRSADLYLKSQWLLNNPATHGVVFATGTPISNTIAEAYTMCRYLDSKGLQEKGIKSFDDFAKLFIDINDGIEPKPDGNGYRMVAKVTGLKNAPEFKRIFRSFADVKMVDDLPEVAKARPAAKRVAVEVPESAWLKNFREKEIAQRVEAIKSRAVDPSEDNILKVMGDFRKATLDPRLIDPNAPAGEANAKIAALVEHVKDEYTASNKTKGAQLVFCDLSIPKSGNAADVDSVTNSEDAPQLSVYERVKAGLIEAGIPADQVKFIHEAKTDAARQQLFEDVNAGRVRVVIGSTAKMGAGTNMQKKLVALHHLDCPWRPRDLEQREDRILRQGNENKNVRIYNYGTKGSFDAVMWDKIRSKANVINQGINGDLSKRVVSEESEVQLSYAEMQMVCSNDPLMIKKLEAEKKVNNLETLQRNHEREQAEISRKIRNLPQKIEENKQSVSNATKDIAERDKHGKDFAITIEGVPYEDRKEANAAMDKAKAHAGAYFKKASVDGNTPMPYLAGNISGFDIRLSPLGETGAYVANLHGYNVYSADTASAVGVYNNLSKAPERRLQYAKEQVTSQEAELANLRKLEGQPFEKAEELKAAQQELDEINAKAVEEGNEKPAPTEEADEGTTKFELRRSPKNELKADNKGWNDLITQRAQDPAAWDKKHSGELYDLMDAPAVFQMFGIQDDKLKVFGSFFQHVIRSKHPGMDDTVLRNLPKAMANPLMILKGNIQDDPKRKVQDSYIFVLSVQDKNGATVIIPVHIGKEIDQGIGTGKHSVIADVVITAYGKTHMDNQALPNYGWFIDQLKKRNAVYINQKKSVAWTVAIRGDSPLGSQLSNALSEYSVDKFGNPVKTEADLAAFKKANPGKYSLEDAEPTIHYTDEELQNEVKSRFSTATNIRDTGHGLVFTMPNGMTIESDFRDGIIVAREETTSASEDYGRPVAPGEAAWGKVSILDDKAIISLTRDNVEGTIDHEAFHVVFHMIFTPQQRSKLLKYAKGKVGSDATFLVADPLWGCIPSTRIQCSGP